MNNSHHNPNSAKSPDNTLPAISPRQLASSAAPGSIPSSYGGISTSINIRYERMVKRNLYRALYTLESIPGAPECSVI